MKVELSIKDDKELRDYIKDMIRGQVLSIVREETRVVLNGEVAKHINGSGPFIVKAINDTINNIVRKAMGEKWNVAEQIRREIRAVVNDVLRDVIKSGKLT